MQALDSLVRFAPGDKLARMANDPAAASIDWSPSSKCPRRCWNDAPAAFVEAAQTHLK